MSAAGRTRFVAAVRRIHSVRFRGIFYADCPRKRILYNERVHGKEEHATSIITIPLKISHLFGFSELNR